MQAHAWLTSFSLHDTVQEKWVMADGPISHKLPPETVEGLASQAYWNVKFTTSPASAQRILLQNREMLHEHLQLKCVSSLCHKCVMACDPWCFLVCLCSILHDHRIDSFRCCD